MAQTEFYYVFTLVVIAYTSYSLVTNIDAQMHSPFPVFLDTSICPNRTIITTTNVSMNGIDKITTRIKHNNYTTYDDFKQSFELNIYTNLITLFVYGVYVYCFSFNITYDNKREYVGSLMAVMILSFVIMITCFVNMMITFDFNTNMHQICPTAFVNIDIKYFYVMLRSKCALCCIPLDV